MNLQEIFNKIWDWTIVQNQPRSVGNRNDFPNYDCGTRCLYRGPNEAKCFIGVLIPDEKYTPSLEGSSIACWSDDRIQQVLGISVDFDSRDPLITLQHIHDADYKFENRENELRGFAKFHNLTVPS